MNYEQYIGKKAILLSDLVSVNGIIDSTGCIRANIYDASVKPAVTRYGDWILAWCGDYIHPHHGTCDRDGFILIIDGRIVYKTPHVKSLQKLLACNGLTEITLYDLV